MRAGFRREAAAPGRLKLHRPIADPATGPRAGYSCAERGSDATLTRPSRPRPGETGPQTVGARRERAEETLRTGLRFGEAMRPLRRIRIRPCRAPRGRSRSAAGPLPTRLFVLGVVLTQLPVLVGSQVLRNAVEVSELSFDLHCFPTILLSFQGPGLLINHH